MNETVKKLVDEYGAKLVEDRRWLHAHPELSFKEFETSRWIRSQLDKAGVRVLSGISGNSVVGVSSSIGVQDWDANHYYYHALNNAGGSASVARSGGWHFYAMSVTPTNQVISVDGVAVYSGVNGVGFDSVTLQTSGPGGSRSYYFDDFAFTPLAPAGTVEITGLKENGTLSWSNSSDLGDALFTIEWAPQLTGVWRTSWTEITGTCCCTKVASNCERACISCAGSNTVVMVWPLGSRRTTSCPCSSCASWGAGPAS